MAILALGSFYHLGVAAAEKIREKTGTAPTVINPYYITGQDTALLEQLKADHKVVITLEDGILDGGFGEKIARVLRRLCRKDKVLWSEKRIPRSL